MDTISRAFYDQNFRIAFLERRGEAFRDLFSTIMEKRYPRGDFLRVRPWGKEGDRKNDGYLNSKRTLFQCYAPDELTAASCISKIEEDFTGALPHWKQYFDTWVFVHNAQKGLGPGVTAKIVELRTTHAPLALETWAFDTLRDIVRELVYRDLADIFGPVPSQRDVLNLGLADLVPVLDQLGRVPPSSNPDLRPVPADKLARNMLSDYVAVLLKVGMSRVGLVQMYFSDRPAKQDEIARGFSQKYQALRDEGLSPDDIFTALQHYAGGVQSGPPAHQVAVLTVLAFFFERCDIFERPDPEVDLS